MWFGGWGRPAVGMPAVSHCRAHSKVVRTWEVSYHRWRCPNRPRLVQRRWKAWGWACQDGEIGSVRPSGYDNGKNSTWIEAALALCSIVFKIISRRTIQLFQAMWKVLTNESMSSRKRLLTHSSVVLCSPAIKVNNRSCSSSILQILLFHICPPVGGITIACSAYNTSFIA